MQCGRGRGLLPYQVASSSIQPFGHNSQFRQPPAGHTTAWNSWQTTSRRRASSRHHGHQPPGQPSRRLLELTTIRYGRGPGRTAAPLVSAHVYCGHGRPSQLLLSSCTNCCPKIIAFQRLLRVSTLECPVISHKKYM